MIFVNMLIMAMVMESAYYIQNFRYGSIWLFAFLPVMVVLGFLGMFRGEAPWKKALFMGIMVLSAYILYYQVKTIDFSAIPGDIGAINSSIMAGVDIQFEDFANTMKLLMVLGSAILGLTLYIFPYNMVILDMGLLLFLWIVDYYNNSYEYVRFFIPVWAFSILFYRSTLLDREVRVLKVNRNRRLVEAIILTLIITVASLFINIDEKGLYSDRVWNYFNGQVVTQTSLNGRSIKDPFSISSSGYNNSDTILGGNIQIDEEEVLYAVGDGPIYLRGNIKTEYLGDRWTKDFKDYVSGDTIPDDLLDTYEGITPGAELKMLEIRPLKEMTSNLFSSIYTRDMEFSNNLALLFYDEEYNVFTSNKTVINDYYITYFDEDIIRVYLTEVENPVEKGADYFARYEEYLTISDTVTQRTRDLVFSLVNDSMGNLEKASILTEYLKTNYSYTLTPGDLPEGNDFVDYFLFEVQEGYCVYFGTALTVMLRIAGVPSRYVEGFKMGNEIRGGRYIVRNSDAHAWTEVLIDEEEGIWQTFDATGTPRELIFGEDPDEENPGGENPLETPDNGVDPTTPRPGEEPVDPEVQEQQQTTRNVILLIIGVILLLFALRIAYRRWKVERMMKNVSLKPYFKELNRALTFMYYTKKPGETYLEMADRIKDDELRENYSALVHEVYKEEYSGEYGEFSRRRELYEDVYGIVKDYRGPVFQFIRKFIT